MEEEANFLISRTIRVVREGDFLEAGLQFEATGVVEKGLLVCKKQGVERHK